MRGYPELVEFPEQNTVFAKDQPQYRPLPCHRYLGDSRGRIVFCWELGWYDRLRVLFSGLLWHEVLTFNQPLQPQLMLTTKPDFSYVNAGSFEPQQKAA
jgi:hypothetical protein